MSSTPYNRCGITEEQLGIDPDRYIACVILEAIAGIVGDDAIFDSDWFEYEDAVTDILKGSDKILKQRLGLEDVEYDRGK